MICSGMIAFEKRWTTGCTVPPNCRSDIMMRALEASPNSKTFPNLTEATVVHFIRADFHNLVFVHVWTGV